MLGIFQPCEQRDSGERAPVSVCWWIGSTTLSLDNFQTGHLYLASETSTGWHKHSTPHSDTGDPPVFPVDPLSQELLSEQSLTFT